MGGHVQQMPGGGHRPPPIMKDLVQGWVKEMVAELKPTPVESHSNTGNSGVAAQWRAGKRSDRARDHECGRCFAFGHWTIQCTDIKRTLEEAIIAGDRERRDKSGADRGRLERLRKEVMAPVSWV